MKKIMSPSRPSTLPRALGSLALAAIFLGMLPSGTRADTFTWNQTAAGPFDWNSTSNWTSAGFPDAVADVANITADLTVNQTINLNQTITVGSMTLGDSGTTGDFSYTIAAGTAGSLIFDNGASAATLSASTTNSNGDTISANIAIGANGLVVNTTSVSGNPVLRLNGTLSGGNLTKTGSARMALGGNNTGWSGTLTVQQGFVIAVAANALTASNAVVVNTGATFDANAAGALTVGSLAGGGRVVLHGAGLSLNVGGGTNVANTITVEGASAFLSPGDSTDPTGALTLEKINSGGINVALTAGSLLLDLASASDFDILNIQSVTDVSALNIDNAFNLTLNLGFAPTEGDTFKIVDIDGSTPITGMFAQGNSVSAVFGGDTYSFEVLYNSSLGGGDGNDIVLLAVPEPGAGALCIVAAISLFVGLRHFRRCRQS